MRMDLQPYGQPRPEVEAPPEWHFPTPEIHTLANGLTVWVYHRPGQYVVSASLVLDVPLDIEESDLEGIATISLHTLDEGTLDHPGTSYAEVLESSGAVFGGSVTLSATTCSVEMPVTSYGRAMALFAEAVRTPALADDDVTRHVALRLADIEQHRANSSHLAGVLTRRAVFDAGSRASRMNGGTSASVARVTPEAVRQFHQTWYSPVGAVLVVAGDFLGSDPLPAVEAAFGDWAPSPGHPLHLPSRPGSARPYVIGRDGSVQADVRLAAFSIDRHDPRWAPLQVASYAMGGAFLSRLNRVLREDRGYTYGISMSPHPLRSGGYWTVGGSFRNEVVAAAVEETQAILDISHSPFTEVEVSQAVSFLTGVAPLRYATAQGVVEQAAALAAAGLDPGYVDRSLTRLRQVTAAEATAAYTELVQDPVLVVVGDPTALAGLGHPVETVPEL